MNFRGKLTATGAVFLISTGLAAPVLADTGINSPEQVYAGPVLAYDNIVLSDVSYSTNRGGLSYGGIVGIDTPVGARGRVGLEGQVSGSTTSFAGAIAGLPAKLSMGVDLYLGAKLGWMVAPKTQIFTTLGFDYAHMALSANMNGIKVGQLTGSRGGLRVGAGVEYALSKQVKARLEYKYTHYGELRLDGYDFGVKMERHQVGAGLLYGF
jgi:outer membrane immunogenic protein